MEHVSKYIMFYVKKHKPPLAMCYNPLLVRDKPPERCICETHLYVIDH